MTEESDKTDAQKALEQRREELLRDFDRSTAATLNLIYQNPERYLPPYSGQKPRETPAPERTTSPERQDPELPPKEKQPPLIEKDPDTRAAVPEFNSPEWRAAQAAEMAKKGVDKEAAQSQILGLLGNARPPQAAVERKPGQAPGRDGRDDQTPGQGIERTR